MPLVRRVAHFGAAGLDHSVWIGWTGQMREDSGTLPCHGDSEERQRTFESTCPKFRHR